MTNAEVERLRELFASEAGFESAEEAPDAERIWLALAGELPAEERKGVVEKVAANPEWAEAWRLAVELREASGVGRQARVLAWKPALRSRYLAAAATIVLALGLGWLWRDAFQTEQPVFRDTGRAPIESLVPAEQPLPRDRFVLRWSPGPEGSRYGLVVTTESLAPVASEVDLEVAEHQIPGEALRDLATGTRILWQVTERRPDGSEVVSATFVTAVE